MHESDMKKITPVKKGVRTPTIQYNNVTQTNAMKSVKHLAQFGLRLRAKRSLKSTSSGPGSVNVTNSDRLHGVVPCW